jgi:hypothetical protein
MEINNIITKIRSINNIDSNFFNKLNKSNREDITITIDNYILHFIYLGHGAQGVAFKLTINDINDNSLNYENVVLKVSTGISKNEIALLNKTSELVFKGATHNFLKVYDQFDIDNTKHITIMELADGNLNNWIKEYKNEYDIWTMIFQIIYSVNIMQKMLKMYHADMKPKNIVYKKLDNTKILKYKINEKIYDIKINYLFFPIDFGHSQSLLLQNNKIPNESIINFITSNADLYELSSLPKRLYVDNLINKYQLSDIKNFSKDINFIQYVKDVEDKIKKELPNYTKQVHDARIKRAILYYLVETNKIDPNKIDVPNFKPNTEITIYLLNLEHIVNLDNELDFLINKLLKFS